MTDAVNIVTEADLAGLSGVIIATTVITNGISHVLSLKRKYVGLMVACLSYFLAIGTFAPTGPGILAAVANVFIVYTGAIGVNDIAASVPVRKSSSATKSSGAEEVTGPKFFGKWW